MRVSSPSHSFALLAALSHLRGSLAAPVSDDTCEPDYPSPSPTPVQKSVQGPEFWAGADFGTLLRMEAIPNRTFVDFDGKTVKDPIRTLADAGVNAARVGTSIDQRLGESIFNNSGDVLARELLFELDWGCIDLQSNPAQRAVASGMKVEHTINMGRTIPDAWLSYDYKQMFEAVRKETKRQLQPFLDVKLVPDIILFENEGTDGFLMIDNKTYHVRGNYDGKASDSQVEQELCGIIPHGNIASYPLLTGFYKGQAQACTQAIAAANLSAANVRYGLHSHGQYVDWKEGIVHGPSPGNQTSHTTPSGKVCDFGLIIPTDILAQNASKILTIMGFSAYPDPMTPTEINSDASIDATLSRLNKTLTKLQSYADAYAKQNVTLRAFGVEYGTGYSYAKHEILQQQRHTARMWELVKRFPSLLGIMWYEPWYCLSDWEGGMAALCHTIWNGHSAAEAPTDTLKTWGGAAVSPWKVLTSNSSAAGSVVRRWM